MTHGLRSIDELDTAMRPITRPPFDGLPLKYWDELGDVSPPDRLVRRLLGTTSLALIAGEPGSGKTFLATDLGVHIAQGLDWFDRPVMQGAVIYVAGEGVAAISNRLVGLRKKLALSDDVPFVMIATAVNLGPEGADATKVIAAAAEVTRRCGVPVRLIIIDTLARNIGVGDENSARDMGALITACDRIKTETEATVLIVHHTGKNNSAGPRGSSALMGAVDTAILVEKRDQGRVAIVSKQKDGADGQEIGFDLEVIDIGIEDDGDAITTCTVKAIDNIPSQAKRRPPDGKAGVVFKALQKAIDDAGETAPGSAHIPSGVRVAAPETWREYAYKMLSDASPDARKKAFSRASASLVSAGYVGRWGPYTWITHRDISK